MQFSTEERKEYPYKLGLRGWVYAGRYRTERYLYILHRISGLSILLYLVLHIWVTWYKVRGEAAWEGVMSFLGGYYFGLPIFKFGEYMLFAAVAFHAANGIRLILTELGFLLGKPKRPIYPFTLAMTHQRILMYFLIALAAVVILYGAYDFMQDVHLPFFN
jgi:succinate dehydrogenase / fumarate reductase cytochrome b subunit